MKLPEGVHMQSVHACACFVRVGHCCFGSILGSILEYFWEPGGQLCSFWGDLLAKQDFCSFWGDLLAKQDFFVVGSFFRGPRGGVRSEFGSPR